MKKRSITRISRGQLPEMIDKTDWGRIAAMSEAEIERAAADDPDALMTTPADWSGAQIVRPEPTEPVTLCLDADVLAWFRQQGRGYRARINSVLRAFVEAQKRAG